MEMWKLPRPILISPTPTIRSRTKGRPVPSLRYLLRVRIGVADVCNCSCKLAHRVGEAAAAVRQALVMVVAVLEKVFDSNYRDLIDTNRRIVDEVAAAVQLDAIDLVAGEVPN